MEKINQHSKEDRRTTRAAMTVVISASLIVYATGFLHALHTQTYFMVKLFTVEAVLAAVIVFAVTRMFHH